MFNNITNFEIIVFIITAISGVLIVYSHLIFPLILKRINKSVKKNNFKKKQLNHYPSITLFIPAYNEEEYIADKIVNLSTLDYPSNKLKIIIYCDGCTDHTALEAQNAINNPFCKDLNINLIQARKNIGKIAVLNNIIPTITSDIVALSDVSALLSMDALLVAAQHFQKKGIGFVGATYDFMNYANAGEETYWRYQRKVKEGESSLGAPIGCHGALYFFRKELFISLKADTVNDDFIIPMNILAQGYKGIYEPEIMALELEETEDNQDFNRRIRIAIGNVQQVFRLFYLLNPQKGGVALNFFSGKALRAFMPIFLILSFVGSYLLSRSENSALSLLFTAGFYSQVLLYATSIAEPILPKSKIVKSIHYIVSGHFAGLIGLCKYMTGQHQRKWGRATSNVTVPSYSPLSVQAGKRAFDITASFFGLIILSPLIPILAVLIKLDSPGPVFFKQKRVGVSTPNVTNFFWMYKFRTMVQDAEKKTGAVWAQKNDPRITRMGKFMRKTRLDELPQLWNVLTGDMSLIGPRPERPELYGKLNKAVPLFAERNYGVKPGITGPAQIHNGYDETIDDVRNKVAYDHSYALSLSNFTNWIMNDVLIVYQTIGVVLGRKGQ